MRISNVACLALTACFFGLLQAMKLEASVSSSTDSAKPKLRIGGQVQDAYLKAFHLWADKTNPDYEIVTSLESYDSEKAAAVIAEMTDAGNSAYVDVLICPYTSAATKACVAAVKPSYRGAILAWGGASDSIFDSCEGLNCFGFFSVASSYMNTGLDALVSVLDYTLDRPVTVGLIVNENTFSESVAAGAEAHIKATPDLKLIDKVELSVAKHNITDTDKSAIAELMSRSPDIVLIAGHNQDVESTIIEIGKQSSTPKAILATNSLTQIKNYGKDVNYANCVMMPTQWAESDNMIDPVIGWTSTGFKKALAAKKGKEERVTYQEAAAAASMVAVANAMKEANYNASMIATKMKEMDLDSFYGKLKWDSSGKIQKPMYTMQMKGDDFKIVAPGTISDQDAGMSISIPLSASRCWAIMDKITGKW